MRGQQIQRRKLGRVQWPATVQRMTETIEDAPHQGVAHRRLQRAAQRDDVAAGMDAVRLAQRHEEDVMPAKADDFGKRAAIVPRRLDAADFADRRHRPFRFNDQPDELHHAPAILEDARLPGALKQMIEAGGHGIWDLRFTIYDLRI